jgi:UDP-2-acetamido-2-deoxy-ribo-hexuluronate aminotransferase
MIPFIDLHPVTKLVAGQVAGRWTQVVDRCEFVGGAGVAALERELAAYCATGTAVACASGTSALVLALQAAGVRPGMHVALPNLTFWATFEAVAQLGAIPVLVDISMDDLQIDLAELQRAHARYRFHHAIVVHLYGWASSALRELRGFCRTHEICLVEDAAQAAGVELDGRPLLADAQIATLSFYPAKVIGGCMDGGAVVSSDPALAQTVRSLANHGRASHYSYQHVGWSSRMGGLAAHYLLEVMQHADDIVRDRRRLIGQYRAQLARGPLAARLRRPPDPIAENGYLLVLECERPAEAYVAQFAARGIGVARTYPETIDEQAPARGRFVAVSELRRSRELVKRVLNLPLYYGMSDHDLAVVVQAAREIVV